jgi:predicted TIM-barrel fold metal-dependent hydrolase
LKPLLEFLHHRAAVVLIHPGELPAPQVSGIPTFTADFFVDTTRTAISLILSSEIAQYPLIKFILAHAGGFAPFIAYRILLTIRSTKNKALQALALLDQERQMPRQLGVLKQFYDEVALSSTGAALPSLLEVAHPVHITYGSDFPSAPAPAVSFIAEQYAKQPMESTLRYGIHRGNAEALFRRLKI